MSRTMEQRDRALAQLARQLGFHAIPLPCYSGPARRRRRRRRRRGCSSVASTAFLAFARGPTCCAARQTRVHPLRETERGFLTRALHGPSSVALLSISLALSPLLARTHALSLAPLSSGTRGRVTHAYNPFARPSFLPMIAPPAAALRVVDEDNDATTAATREPAMPPLPRTT